LSYLALHFNLQQCPTWDNTPGENPDTVSGPRCRARFDFEGESADDLTFEEGDIIQLVEQVGDEWLKGNVHGKTGLFPVAFVEIIEDFSMTGAPNDAAIDAGDRKGIETEDENTAKVMHDFNGEEGELSLKVSDVFSFLCPRLCHGLCVGGVGVHKHLVSVNFSVAYWG
jgi:hypothetical protein